MEDLENRLIGSWLHSHEEDTPQTRVYRPADYSFPPSRGRSGYEFRTDGTLTYYGIAAADGSEEFSGRWTTEGENTVRITVDNERIKPMVLDVLSCEDDRFTVRRQ
jgi:hypothetical protein